MDAGSKAAVLIGGGAAIAFTLVRAFRRLFGVPRPDPTAGGGPDGGLPPGTVGGSGTLPNGYPGDDIR